PPYRRLELAQPVQVEVFLQRLTDSARSQARPFTYLPAERDPYGIEAKRRKKPPGYMEHFAPLPPA
ncbi:RELB factor, partial [Podargus strigoides]|nr:RELB factor [Podargus strigoides]